MRRGSRASGTNPRATGNSPRQRGRSARQLGVNPRELYVSPRQLEDKTPEEVARIASAIREASMENHYV